MATATATRKQVTPRPKAGTTTKRSPRKASPTKKETPAKKAPAAKATSSEPPPPPKVPAGATAVYLKVPATRTYAEKWLKGRRSLTSHFDGPYCIVAKGEAQQLVDAITDQLNAWRTADAEAHHYDIRKLSAFRKWIMRGTGTSRAQRANGSSRARRRAEDPAARVKRLAAAKHEWNVVKAWHAKGRKGKRPEVSNLETVDPEWESKLDAPKKAATPGAKRTPAKPRR